MTRGIAVMAQKLNQKEFIMEKQNPPSWQEFEKLVVEHLRKNGYPDIEHKFKLEIGTEEKKAHAFDAGQKGVLVVECKASSWTEGDNSPSAKISAWNEAMYFFYLAPPKYQKYFFVLKSDNEKGESLLTHYINSYQHVIPKDVRLFEYDPQSKEFNEFKDRTPEISRK
jgi:hypothetical protein